MVCLLRVGYFPWLLQTFTAALPARFCGMIPQPTASRDPGAVASPMACEPACGHGQCHQGQLSSASAPRAATCKMWVSWRSTFRLEFKAGLGVTLHQPPLL